MRQTVQLGPVKAFITHGHLYNVTRNTVDSLVYAAQEQGAKIALFGHTHSAYNGEAGGVKVTASCYGKSATITIYLVDG